jgi:putative spermidine/putrescine transport system ATP-binding protein
MRCFRTCRSSRTWRTGCGSRACRSRSGRVAAALSTVRLEGYGPRRPGQLSGGQRQRVALARALVNRPKVLLLDEPLGALDRQLREQMQIELKAIQREVGITFLFVTHDQDEALTMSDRIAVFNAGRVEQVGTPEEIYQRPATAFVAGFVGTSNLLTGAAAEAVFGTAGTYSVRPERIRVLSESDSPGDGVAGTVVDVIYAGAQTRLHVDTDAGVRMIAAVPNTGADNPGRTRGERVRLVWPRADIAAVAANS